MIEVSQYGDAPMNGYPVFFVVKEGADGEEDDFLSVKELDDNFYKVSHRIEDNVYEQIEIGTIQSEESTDNKMIGVRVDVD
jgi:hypothetical protein